MKPFSISHFLLYLISGMIFLILTSCGLDEIPSEIKVATFERFYGGNSYNNAIGAVQLDDGDYIIAGIGNVQMRKLNEINGDEKDYYVSNYQNFWISDILKSNQNHVVVCGFLTGNGNNQISSAMITEFNEDLCIKKQALTNEASWPGIPFYNSIILTNDNQYALLGNNKNAGSPFISKVPPNLPSAPEGNSSFSDYSSSGLPLIQSKSGNYAFIADNSLLITESNSTTNIKWTLPLPNFGAQQIITTKNNNYALVGNKDERPHLIIVSSNRIKLKDIPIGNKNGTFRDIKESPDGGYILTGEINTLSNGSDAYLVRLDDNFDMVWERNYGSSLNDEGRVVIPTRDGGFLLAGMGDRDFYVVKTDSNGCLNGRACN